jgi:hypothetical protein
MLHKNWVLSELVNRLVHFLFAGGDIRQGIFLLPWVNLIRVQSKFF